MTKIPELESNANNPVRDLMEELTRNMKNEMNGELIPLRRGRTELAVNLALEAHVKSLGGDAEEVSSLLVEQSKLAVRIGLPYGDDFPDYVMAIFARMKEALPEKLSIENFKYGMRLLMNQPEEG